MSGTYQHVATRPRAQLSLYNLDCWSSFSAARREEARRSIGLDGESLKKSRGRPVFIANQKLCTLVQAVKRTFFAERWCFFFFYCTVAVCHRLGQGRLESAVSCSEESFHRVLRCSSGTVLHLHSRTCFWPDCHCSWFEHRRSTGEPTVRLLPLYALECAIRSFMISLIFDSLPHHRPPSRGRSLRWRSSNSPLNHAPA